jgi:cysteine synthase A
MPANISSEKVELARTLGARVHVCPVVPFSDPRHYYQAARRLAEETPGGCWGNQFEGLQNAAAHAATTGPEIWAQAGGRVDALALSAGTGGTIGGLTTYLRGRNPALRVFLIDPPGSSLAGYVETGEVRPGQGTTVTEGIGNGRITANFAAAAGSSPCPPPRRLGRGARGRCPHPPRRQSWR